jgi:hypothetical protein
MKSTIIKLLTPRTKTLEQGHYGNVDKKTMTFLYDMGFRSMLDIGCGNGYSLFSAIDIGFTGHGLDYNSKNEHIDFIHHVDYSKGRSNLSKDVTYDIGISIEFLEHVESKFHTNYINDFKRCSNILITAAPPGTPGINHVNLQTENYWIEFFTAHGFTFNKDITSQIRSNSEIKYFGEVRRPEKQFIKLRGLFFEKTT